MNCIVFFLSAFCLQAQQFGVYPIQNYSSQQYEAGNQNIDFSQNRNATLFVANNLGVLSFNGNRWENHQFGSYTKTRSLAFDEQTNRLYVGTQGDLGYFQNKWEYISLKEKIPATEAGFDEVWDIFILNGKVYFCTFKAIYEYTNNQINVIESGALAKSFVVENQLYVQRDNGELLRLVHDEFITVETTTNGTISSIVQSEEHTLLFYNSGLIETLQQPNADKAIEKLSKRLQRKYVNAALKLADHRIVIATQTDGLYIYSPTTETVEHISKKDGLQSNTCLNLYQDYLGNLWVGMQNGIAVLNVDSPMRLTNHEFSIEGSGYSAFETEAYLYMSSSSGIYSFRKETKTTEFLQGTEGPAYTITEINGKVYAGHHTGLFLLSENKAVQVAETVGLWNIQQLKQDPHYAIAGTYEGIYLFHINENGYLEPEGKLAGFEESTRFFEEDRSGSIWVSQYNKSVYRLRADLTSKTVTAKEIKEGALPSQNGNIVTSISGDIFFATQNGIYFYEPVSDQIRPAEMLNEYLTDEPVYMLKEGKKGNIYFLGETKAGIFNQLGPNNYQYQPSSLLAMKYQIDNDLLQASTTVNNGLFISANEGFIAYYPSLEKTVQQNQTPFVRSIYSTKQDSTLWELSPFEEAHPVKQPVTIAHSFNSIEISAETYNTRNKEYQFYLEGFDNSYSDWTSNPAKEYTNLPGGNYSLYIRTRNPVNETTLARPIQLHVKPHFLQSKLALIIYLIIGSGLFYSLYKWQQSRYQQKTRKITASKQQEIENKQEELQTVKQDKEQAISKLKEEKLESELEHMNNLLAASTMNLVVKNEFIEKLKEQLKTVKKKGKTDETKQAIQSLVKEIDTNLRLQEDWERFEHHFDQVHGDFLDRLREDHPDLTPQDQKLCAYLRLNLNTKEIAQLLSISVRGAEMARYRLRKRLDLDTEQNLSKFILEY